MADKKIQMQDFAGNRQYPVTLTSLVYDENGKVLQDRLAALEVFLEWFEWGDTEHKSVKAKYHLWSVGQVSASGKGEEGEGGGGAGMMLLVTWDDAITDADLEYYALGANLGKELKDRISVLENETTQVSIYDLLQKGDKIGTIKVDGQEYYIRIPKLANVATSGSYNDLTSRPSLASVATSGSYDDLYDKPDIPDAITESTISGWGFTKNEGTYVKPTSGIPSSDLDSDVQDSLKKADTALQSFSESDPIFKASAAAGIKDTDIYNWNGKTSNIGTITGIKMNGSSMGTSGVVDLGTVITAHQSLDGYATKEMLEDYLPISGGTIDGELEVTEELRVKTLKIGDVTIEADGDSLKIVSGAYTTGQLSSGAKAVEAKAVIAPLELTSMPIASTTTEYTDAQIASEYGLTKEVLDNLARGIYTRVTITYLGTPYVWDYEMYFPYGGNKKLVLRNNLASSFFKFERNATTGKWKITNA